MAGRPGSPWYEIGWMAISADQLEMLKELGQCADSTGFVARDASHDAVRKVKGDLATAQHFPWRILDQLIVRGLISRIKRKEKVTGYALTCEGRIVAGLPPLDPQQIDPEAGDGIVDLCCWQEIIAISLRLDHLLKQCGAPTEIRLEADRALAFPKAWLRLRINAKKR